MIYQIKVQGEIDSSWSEWFNGMKVSSEQDRDARWVTTFTGGMNDQAALRGILNRLWDLNAVILSMQPLEEPTNTG